MNQELVEAINNDAYDDAPALPARYTPARAS